MRLTSLFAAMSTVVLVACSKEGTSSADSARMADSATVANATVPASAPAMTDANIFALLDEVNMADSSAGKMASTKGTSADVKAFGVLMMNDHHMLRKGGQDLAAKLGVTPMAPAGDMMPAKAQAMADTMTATPKGAAWDKWYIDHEVMMHQELLGMIDAGLAAAQNAEVKDMLTKARPAVEAHLKRAQEIQGKMPAGSTT